MGEENGMMNMTHDDYESRWHGMSTLSWDFVRHGVRGTSGILESGTLGYEY